MTIVKFVCKGIRPLLMERMTEEVLESLLKGTRLSPKNNVEPAKIAEEKLYRDPQTGKLAIPADNFWACLVEGGRHVSYKGKIKISTAEESILPGVMDIKEEYLPLVTDDGWKVDKRRGRLKTTGAAVCIVRPRFDKWSFSGTLEIDDDVIEVEKIKELVNKAGRYKGLGGHRKKGRFGRFQIVSWEVISSDSKKRKKQSEAEGEQ